MSVRISIRPPDTTKVAKVVIFDGDKVLLLLRKTSEKHGGKWDLPGGHILEGEDWLVGATRETKEETDLEVTNLREIWKHKNKKFFSTRSWNGSLFSRDSLPEHDDYHWAPYAEIETLTNISDMFVSAIRRAIK